MRRVVVTSLLALAACKRQGADLELVDIKSGDLVIGVAVVGALEAVDSTDIKPPAVDIWNFKIAMLAPEGAEVKAGAPIAGFDSSEQVRNLEARQNEVDAAQKQLDKKRDDVALARREEELAIAQAEANLRKATLKRTQPDDLVASVDRKLLELDEATARIALDQAKNKAARQRRSDDVDVTNLTEKRVFAAHEAAEIEKNIAKMVVTAPRAGTIVYPVGWRGEKKKVGDGTYRLEAVLKVVGLDKMRGEGQVDEVDLARVATRQVVALQLDALPDVQLRGTVESIAKALQPKSQADPSKVITIKFALDPTTAPLRPGMRFRGEIETARVAHVTLIPAVAIFVGADGPIAYRVARDGGAVEKVKLVLGRRNADVVEVKAGLVPGDRVARIDPERRRK
ncbi:MAG: HlyD family efflux transporter periplasmic adaptor subunit [Proteobacteria bacterium]|nr:HlyD family efflux transporter periplasmic adaptor subunit [Pseudomonadota bacterium]